MTFSRLMLQITHQRLLVTETCCELFRIGEIASSVLADIKDESVAEGEVLQDLVQSAIADRVCETAVVCIAETDVQEFL